MPKKAFDYGNTEIYKIIHVDPDINLTYVGHTTNFVQRRKNHKNNCVYYGRYNTDYDKYANDNNVYGIIQNNGGWGNFKMVFVEKWPCENKRQACAREQHWIDILKPTMNICMAQRDPYEWHIENRESKNEYGKKYYHDNKESKIEYGKKYYQDNKAEIQEKAVQPYTCTCGSTIQWRQRPTHFTSKKHVKWLGES